MNLLSAIQKVLNPSNAIIIILLLSSTWTNAQTVQLSGGVGVLSKKLTVSKLERAIGQPDSIYDNSKPYGKNAAYYKLIYNELGVTFWYSTNRGSRSVRGSSLGHIELLPNTTLQLDGFELKDLDTASVRANYGNPNSVSFYQHETLFNYDFRKGKRGTLLRFRWNLDGSLRKIEVFLVNYI